MKIVSTTTPLTKNQAAMLRRVYAILQGQNTTTASISLRALCPTQGAQKIPGQSRTVAEALIAKGLLRAHEVAWQRQTYVGLTLKGRASLGLPLRVTAYDVKELCGPCPNQDKGLPPLNATRDGDFLVVRIPFEVPPANANDE